MGAVWELIKTKAPQLGLEKPEPRSNYVTEREHWRSLWQCWGAELGVFMLPPPPRRLFPIGPGSACYLTRCR